MIKKNMLCDICLREVDTPTMVFIDERLIESCSQCSVIFGEIDNALSLLKKLSEEVNKQENRPDFYANE